MLGRTTLEPKLFHQFSLEERVPQDHLLRRVAAVVDFSIVRRLTARFSSHTGQPEIDPVVLFMMALLGWLYGITSERRLAEEERLNLAFVWFVGYATWTSGRRTSWRRWSAPGRSRRTCCRT
jgi:transposase